MPFWIKYTEDGASYPVAGGPYQTRDEVEAVIASRQSPPEGYDVPSDAGEVVEADLDYPSTLKHPTGKMAIGDVDHVMFSDGTAEPVE